MKPDDFKIGELYIYRFVSGKTTTFLCLDLFINEFNQKRIKLWHLEKNKIHDVSLLSVHEYFTHLPTETG